ncbi:MAG: hypothetical protein Q8J88_13640 [Bacteroidales bacterium]|nr:hypothetical protein [Bacteroidales bacterium]
MEKVFYDLELSKKLYAHYIENEIGYSSVCQRCKSYSASKGRILKNGPIPVFHIGDQFSESPVRILFLGTVAYGWENEIPNVFIEDKDVRNNFLESTIDYIENRIQYIFEKENKRFFSFIKKCIEEIDVLGSEPLRKIALSNLIKCNIGNDSVRNKHLQKNYDFCIREQFTGNLVSDVNVLNPTHIIILSSNTHKFWRYGKIFMDQGRKVQFVHHPSSSTTGGNELFIKTVKEFLINTKV